MSKMYDWYLKWKRENNCSQQISPLFLSLHNDFGSYLSKIFGKFQSWFKCPNLSVRIGYVPAFQSMLERTYFLQVLIQTNIRQSADYWEQMEQ